MLFNLLAIANNNLDAWLLLDPHTLALAPCIEGQALQARGLLICEETAHSRHSVV